MLRRLILLALLLIPSRGLFASDLSALRAEYENKTRLIRNFYSADKLQFDSSGKLKNNSASTAWTSSFLEIDSVSSQRNVIEIKGHRVGRLFDHNDRRFKGVRSKHKVTITLDLAEFDLESAARTALAQIFVDDTERIIPLVPAYWHSLLERFGPDGVLGPDPKPGSAEVCETAPQVPCKVGKNIKAPKVIKFPDPDYDRLADKLHVQGTSVLWVVIDETGHPADIKIVRPIGCGLDDRAVAAVSRWLFKPATRDGVPVKVQINVEVNFRLY